MHKQSEEPCTLASLPGSPHVHALVKLFPSIFFFASVRGGNKAGNEAIAT